MDDGDFKGPQLFVQSINLVCRSGQKGGARVSDGVAVRAVVSGLLSHDSDPDNDKYW